LIIKFVYWKWGARNTINDLRGDEPSLEDYKGPRLIPELADSASLQDNWHTVFRPIQERGWPEYKIVEKGFLAGLQPSVVAI
jgi:hypothetical protein